MDRIFLNARLIEAHPPDVSFTCQNLVPGGLSRRRFLQGMGAATLTLSQLVKASVGPRVDYSDKSVSLAWEGVGTWSIDTSWLAGQPHLGVQEKGDIIEIELTGARYPATELSADFRATLRLNRGVPVVRMEHSLSVGEVENDLDAWLRGETDLVLAGRCLPFSMPVGRYLHVQQVEAVQLHMTPDLEVRAIGANAWIVEGSEFSGRASGFAISRVASEGLICADYPLQRAHILVTPSPDRGIKVMPTLARAGLASYKVGTSTLTSLLIETAEVRDGRRHYAFLSQSAGAVVVSDQGGSSPDSGSVRVIAREPRFARSLASDGESQVLLAGVQGQGMASFGQHTLVTTPVSSRQQLKISDNSAGCLMDCAAYPQSLALASDSDISILLRFPSGTYASDKPDAARPEICPFTLGHRELSLDGAEITFKRPANALLLRFRFQGFKLVRNWKGIKVVVSDNAKARLKLVLGAQAVVEQAYFESPTNIPLPTETELKLRRDRLEKWLELQYDKSNAPLDKRKEFVESALKQYDIDSKDSGSEWKRGGSFPSSARIAHESQLVYRLRLNASKEKVDKLSLDISHLLDEELWELVVTQDAASTEQVRNDPSNGMPTQVDKSQPPADATYLEMPSSLYISPNEEARFRVEGLDTGHASGFKDIFRIAAVAQTPEGIPLRAIGARGFQSDVSLADLPHFDPARPKYPDAIGFRTPVDMRDRAEFVWLTSQWNYAALPGTKDVREKSPREVTETQKPGFDGVYVPRPFHASKLLLSSMGGSLKSLGRWDPPALGQFALSVERWEHSSSFAKSDNDIVVYKGFLLPFGIRCALIKVTKRQERRLNDMGVMSLPIQKFYIELGDPKIEYTGALAPFQGRTWPFRSIELLLGGRLEIDDPTKTEFCNLGQSAFRICVGCEGYRFVFQIDGDPKRRGNARLAFIDNSVAHDVAALECVANALNQLSPEAWAIGRPCFPANPPQSDYYIDVLNSKIQYAPPKNGDDTSYVTGKMFVHLYLDKNLVNSAIIEASGKPPTFPEMASASIVIPALNRLTGRSDKASTDVQFPDLFKQIGFDAKADVANASEVFLQLVEPVTMSFSGKGDRSGAVAAPNIDAYLISRHLGLMGNPTQPLTPPDGSNGQRPVVRSTSSRVSFKGTDLFRRDAKVLGVLPMPDLFDALDLNEVPRFIESAQHQIDAAADQVAIRICEFVAEGASAVHDIVRQLGNNIKYEPVRVLKRDLEEFAAALGQIGNTECGPGSFDLSKAMEQIALAGRALDRARRTIDDIVHNPATLLPAPVRKLVETWTGLVNEIVMQYELLQELASKSKDRLTERIRVLNTALTTYANEMIAAELNVAYTKLSHSIDRIATMAVPVERQIQQILEIYETYAGIYQGMATWYSELHANKEEYQKILTVIANQVILQGAAQTTSYAGMVTRKIEQPLRDLDTSLRQWGTLADALAQEQGRAFFRRYEPSITRASEALLSLLRLQANAVKLPQHLEDLRQSLNDLAQAVEQETKAPAIAAQFKDYLEKRVQPSVETVQARLGEAALQLQSTAVTAGGPMVAAEVKTLRDTLASNGAVVLPRFLDATLDVWTQGIGTPENLDRMLQTTNGLVQLCVIAGSGLGEAMKAINQIDGLVQAMMQEIHGLLVAWIRAIDPLNPAWLVQVKEYGYLFAPDFIRDLETKLLPSMADAYKKLEMGQTYVTLPASSEFQSIVIAITQIDTGWRVLAAQLKALGEAPERVAMEAIKGTITGLAEQLVPAEVHLDFELNVNIRKEVGGVFQPGTAKVRESRLELKSTIRQNLKTGSSSAAFTGQLRDFRLNMMGFLIITFAEIRFKALSGSTPKLYPPNITDIDFDGCLAFINGLKDFFRTTSGPYVLPMPSGIHAGYALRPGTIPLPGMVLQDLVIDAGIEVPYDDRAALTTFAVSSRQSPALLFMPPYGGAMFFGLSMAGDRLVNVEASFEAGLVSAFDLGAVVGSGRVTFGFYYRQVGNGMKLEGFFYAGGHGTVLEMVALSIGLRIGLSYQGSQVAGYGDFSVEMGHSPFSWTLNYRVEREVRNVMSTQSMTPDNILISKQKGEQENTVLNLRTDPISDLFLNRATWREFQSAFARV